MPSASIPSEKPTQPSPKDESEEEIIETLPMSTKTPSREPPAFLAAQRKKKLAEALAEENAEASTAEPQSKPEEEAGSPKSENSSEPEKPKPQTESHVDEDAGSANGEALTEPAKVEAAEEAISVAQEGVSDHSLDVKEDIRLESKEENPTEQSMNDSTIEEVADEASTEEASPSDQQPELGHQGADESKGKVSTLEQPEITVKQSKETAADGSSEEEL